MKHYEAPTMIFATFVVEEVLTTSDGKGKYDTPDDDL